MPVIDPAPFGAPCWIDLFTADPDRAAAFYGAIFDWTAHPTGPEFGGYVNFTKDGVLVAGMVRNDGSHGVPDCWTTYLAVADAEATAAAARRAGGQVQLEPMQVGDLGTMAVLADPGGAVIGLWQPGEHTGYGLGHEPGSPCRHELHTRDHAAVLDFYRTVFGVQPQVMSDSDDVRYTQLMIDGQARAGVLDVARSLPRGVPSTWRVGIGVADVDATLARAVELGGAVVEPARETPFGRLAALADPTGAVIELASGMPQQ